MFRIAILASGNGSNFQAIVDAARAGRLSAEITGLICNVPGARVIERAEQAGVPIWVMPSKGVQSPEEREAFDRRLGDAIGGMNADLVVLAGYMRLLSPAFIRRFPMRIVNIHPSLLPAFPGVRVHEAVLAHGCKVTGCTVHFVDEGLDSGPIIAQECVRVLDGDTPETLAQRVHAVEHRLYPWAIDQIARGRVRVEGRIVHIATPSADMT